MKKLHLGCGNRIISDFTNIDIRKNDGVDIVDDISTLSTFNNNSVDLIYACHVLEHFKRNEFEKVIKRWFDLLKVDGILRLAVPDFEAITKRYNQTKNLNELMGLLYGGQSYENNFHYICFDEKLVTNILMSVGFSTIRRWNWKETDHSHIDDFSQAYLPHMDKENGTLMSLNIEAIK